MRCVPSGCLRAGQILAIDLVYKDTLFLRKGIPLTNTMITRIQSLGFQGVYIDDDLSRDLVVANVISDGLQMKAKQEIRSLYMDAGNQMSKQLAVHLRTIDNVINNMVDEILNNHNTMVNVIDLRTFDDYTFCHSVNVAVLCVVIGTVLQLEMNKLRELAMGALVHDIGKVFVDKNIIMKPSQLMPDEMEEMKKHSQIGYDYLKTYGRASYSTLRAVLSHHEQYNGNGYPDQLSGQGIHLFARIICVADVYDALTSDRPYRSAMLPSDAMEYIMSGYQGMFDPLVVTAFVRKVAPYPLGTCVRLSNGVTGIVMENYELYGMRPLIRVFQDGKLTEEYIDLAHDRSALNVTVLEVLKM